MNGFNKVMLMGNVTRDPQLKYLPSQTPVAEFGLACNRRFKTAQGEDKEETLFVDVTAFGKQAETIHQYVQKGKGLFVEGRLKYDTWDDKNGGGKRSKISVIVENFQFLGGRGDHETDGGNTADRRSAGGDGEEWKSADKESAGAKPKPTGPAKRTADLPFKSTTSNSNRKFKEADIPF
jgi:single-strand DNA-binding protein